MNITVLMKPGHTGCELYRILFPYIELKKRYADITVDIYDVGNNATIPAELIENTDVFIFHKNHVDTGLIDYVHGFNKKVIIDFDDWIELPKEHILYKGYIDNDMTNTLIKYLSMADYVTTTNQYLKDLLLQYNQNIFIFENSIPYEAFPVVTKYDKLRIGFTGGACHLHDLKIINGLLSYLSNIKYEFYLFGASNEPVYNKYISTIAPHRIFTKYLKLVPSVAPENFLGLYQMINACIAPLVDNTFNAAKSNLKYIEAATFKMPLIASNVPTYNKDIVNDTTGILCNHKKDFVDAIVYLSRNLDKVQSIGEAANKDVLERYNFYNILERRYQLFMNIK